MQTVKQPFDQYTIINCFSDIDLREFLRNPDSFFRLFKDMRATLEMLIFALGDGTSADTIQGKRCFKCLHPLPDSKDVICSECLYQFESEYTNGHYFFDRASNFRYSNIRDFTYNLK